MTSRILNVSIAALISLVVLAAPGCATIPKESVGVSQTIGSGLSEGRRSYHGLLNQYFIMKKEKIDRWIDDEYLPKHLENIERELRAEGMSATLSPAQVKDLLHDVLAKRDLMQADLEKTRLLLIEKSDEFYASLIQANGELTGLLRSAVDVNDATSSAGETARGALAPKIPLDRLNASFDKFLNQTETGQNASFYEDVRSILSEKGE